MSSFTGKARRSALHTSSRASFFQTSGPLQSGQTRISSSFGSTCIEAFDDEYLEFGIDQCVDAHRPHASVGECGAFYGILFGHDDDLRAGELQVGRGVGVVIGKRRAARGDAEALEVLEEASRVADPRDGGDPSTARPERE